MKASELMIDDWVNIDIPDPYSGSRARIMSLAFHKEDDGQYFKVFIYGNKGCLIRDVFNEDLRPIELKKIHLIKNGFYAKDMADTIFVFRDRYQITVQFDEGINDPENDLQIPPLAYLSIKFAEKDLWLPIEYVHELQHAMRLFGIDKQINL